MANSARTEPPPCNPKIHKKGKSVCIVDGGSEAVERWVKSVAKKARAKVDWHYIGGRANVLHLGDEKSWQRVLNAIHELESELDGTIISIYGPTLCRRGVEDPEALGARVEVVEGRTVLVDPEAAQVANAVNKHNCQNTLEQNAERVEHFKLRFADRHMTADQAVIVLLNVDDVHGGPIAEAIMPGFNWQEIRDQNEVPFARGLDERKGIQEILETFDKEAARKLSDMASLAVVVIDHGVAEVFAA